MDGGSWTNNIYIRNDEKGSPYIVSRTAILKATPFAVFISTCMVWLVLSCSRTRYASITLALYLDYLRLFGLLCLTVCDHIIRCISLG